MILVSNEADRMLNAASEMLAAEMPTLDEAVGCLDCKAIRRMSDNSRCIVCDSEAIFDVAALLNNATTAAPTHPRGVV